MRKWLVRAVVVALVLGAAFAGTCLVFFDPAYFVRAFSYPEREVTDVAWYTPLAEVRGRAASDLPLAAEPSIAAQALAAAAAWADEKNSSALLVLHRGEIVLERYWRGHDAGARSNSMSMAKTIVGLLVGIAIEERAIASLDEPAATYLPEWADDERAAITIRHLLGMASGLGESKHDEDPLSDVGYMYLGTDSRYIVAHADLARAPGTRYEYNSVNTQALAFALEAATGVPYHEYLAQKLWIPLGAGDAAIWLDEQDGAAKAFCCLFATARDWARVGLLFQNSGMVGGRAVVPAAWIAEMTRPSALEPDYGLHLWVGARGGRAEDCAEAFLAGDVLYLDGRRKQRVWVVPSARLVAVRIGEDADDFDDCFLVNTLLRGIVPQGESAGAAQPPEAAGERADR